jgi:hypothetical protein
MVLMPDRLLYQPNVSPSWLLQRFAEEILLGKAPSIQIRFYIIIRRPEKFNGPRESGCYRTAIVLGEGRLIPGAISTTKRVAHTIGRRTGSERATRVGCRAQAKLERVLPADGGDVPRRKTAPDLNPAAPRKSCDIASRLCYRVSRLCLIWVNGIERVIG